MNIIDIIIIAVIAVSVLYGMYRGFISSVLGIASVILSVFIATTMSGQVADTLKKNETLIRTLTYYTDAGSRIRNNDVSDLPASSLTQPMLDGLLNEVRLPDSFRSVFVEEIRKAAAEKTQKVSEILSRTIVNVSISILSFLITFLIAFLISTLLVHMIAYVFEFPVLRHLDALVGGVFGGIRGILLVFILFALVPLVMAVVPVEAVGKVISESKLAPMFDSKIIFMILNRL
ncbi:MAG: CvpA family protein [Clostridia bacterium]|nr:CvpA family protein [Clostridia bacterium]